MQRLLIVDDEPGVRSVLSCAFRRAGYEVRTAADPFQAMQLCTSEPFDAILSDVQMPGMDGHSLIRWVASTHPHIRSILMSGYDIQCGNCPYEGRCTLIQKPFLPREAVETVTRALAERAD
jgi:DNA-binding NtrC family response regulator